MATPFRIATHKLNSLKNRIERKGVVDGKEIPDMNTLTSTEEKEFENRGKPFKSGNGQWGDRSKKINDFIQKICDNKENRRFH